MLFDVPRLAVLVLPVLAAASRVGDFARRRGFGEHVKSQQLQKRDLAAQAHYPTTSHRFLSGATKSLCP